MDASFLTARSRPPCAARSPAGRAMPRNCSPIGWNSTQDGIDGLENLLWKCHHSRRLILPPFSLETFRREVEANPLFEIDLEAEAERFKKALQGAGVKHAGTLKAILERLTVLSEFIRRSGRSVGTLLDDEVSGGYWLYWRSHSWSDSG